jgi:uncharacterized protein (DUF2147 family)
MNILHHIAKLAAPLAPLALLTLLITGHAAAASATEPLLGLWQGSDEGSNPKTTSIIEVFAQGDRLNARIVRTLDAQGQEIHPVCTRCPGELQGKPTRGMVFVRDLRKQGEQWVDGRVIDLRPGSSQGWTATCDLTLINGQAVLHGYMGLRAFGQSSRWKRLTEADNKPTTPSTP